MKRRRKSQGRMEQPMKGGRKMMAKTDGILPDEDKRRAGR